MIDVTVVVNKYLRMFLKYPANSDKKEWSWTPEQIEILHISRTKKLIKLEKPSLSQNRVNLLITSSHVIKNLTIINF